MPQRGGAVHVSTTRRHYKDKVYETVLLRRSYREGGKVKNETVGNLSHLPADLIDLIKRRLGDPDQRFVPVRDLELKRSLAHGHVLAVQQMMRKLGFSALLDPASSRDRDLVLAMIAARVLEPASKLATTRLWQESTLATDLGVADADEDELYRALDWLLARQPKIEKRLADRHFTEGGLVLYDLSSSYLEGRHCKLARIGYSRDRKRGSLQIEYGLITDAEGRPVAVEVFEGNTGDPATVASQVQKLKQNFKLGDLVLVGDRGMLTSARIEALQEVEGLAWISCLRGPQIQALVESGNLQLSFFDERNLAEISDPAFPGERLIVCKNTRLAQERKRKREDLLAATELKLAPVVELVAKGKLKGAAQIGLRVGKLIDRHKVGKHLQLEISDDRLAVSRKEAEIAAEAALDGIYVLRTSLPVERLDTVAAVRSYKLLVKVERAFRSFKSIDLQVRPIHHYSDDRVRAHILLCMLAYYVRWHLEEAWSELLFKDEVPPLADDPVAPARRSAAALRKASTQQLPDGSPVHSWRTLLAALRSLTRNRVLPKGAPDAAAFEMVATPTPLQAKALALIAAFKL
ncbi:MAG TPA: IS1634 family transposase [Candidatus Dormibacteraeota bacterium]|nr:IS1634 family transposase [Candidatus Dormibacteraeota bacterium]